MNAVTRARGGGQRERSEGRREGGGPPPQTPPWGQRGAAESLVVPIVFVPFRCCRPGKTQKNNKKYEYIIKAIKRIKILTETTNNLLKSMKFYQKNYKVY